MVQETLAERRLQGEKHLIEAIEKSRADDLVLLDLGGPSNLVATVTINRPRYFNAINTSAWIALTDTFRGLPRDGSIRAVILRGAGKNFSQGADLHELLEIAEGLDHLEGDEKEREGINTSIAYFGLVHDTLDAIEEYPFDVICEGRGYELGAGLELAISCDDRYGDETLKTGVPAAEKDIMLPPEDIRRFIETIGVGHTSEILSTGAIYDARNSLRLLVVNGLIDSDKLTEFVWNLALEKTKQAPEAVRARKAGILLFKRNAAFTKADIVPEIHYGWGGSENFYGALRSFKAKRPPQFGLMVPRDYRPNSNGNE